MLFCIFVNDLAHMSNVVRIPSLISSFTFIMTTSATASVKSTTLMDVSCYHYFAIQYTDSIPCGHIQDHSSLLNECLQCQGAQSIHIPSVDFVSNLHTLPIKEC